ncbi:MAG TPA: NAD(P)/FAD-dependent oxidoreductase [Pseudonocardia sp.]|jgi:2-polyprenyl-6-methoxyphenol hydroxylase-like FAD-dependent oxidoreductase
MVHSPEQADVVIVGARCAGTASAVPLARAGHRVVLIDKSRFPSDQLSTHVLVPNGVAELQHMGALPHALRLNPARSRYLGLNIGDVRVRERFTPVDGIDYAVCIPRPEQDMCLVTACREAGAEVREKCQFEDVVWDAGRAVGVRYRDGSATREIRAKLVIGADGRRSRMAAEVGSWEPYRGSLNGRGFAFRYLDDPQAGSPEGETLGVYRTGDSTCLVLPSSPVGRVLVVFMAPASDIPRFQADVETVWAEKLADDPALAERLEGATNADKLRATAKLVSFYRASTGPGWALAGDAGHFKDPVVGQGQRDALRHGRLLGEAVRGILDDPGAVDAALRAWERRRDRDTRSTYHWGNRETVAVAPSLLVREVFRTFEGDDSPDASDTFNRMRKIERIIGPGRMARAFATALVRAHGDRGQVLREATSEIPTELGIRWENLRDEFRYAGWAPSERPGWSVGRPPAARATPTPEDRAVASSSNRS